MKIIFDNEEQKKFLLRALDRADLACPSDIGLKDCPVERFACTMDCDECWANCGIEWEVSDNE